MAICTCRRQSGCSASIQIIGPQKFMGFLSRPTTVGLKRVDQNIGPPPAVTVTTAGGPGYGVNALPNGNVVYDAGSGSTDIHIYNPGTNTDSLVYTAPALID